MKAASTLKIISLSFLMLFIFALKTTAQKTSIEFTEEELEWISSHQTLNVANELDWPPFDFVDADQNPTGYSIDLIKLVAKKTRLDINIVNGYSWDKILDLFKKDSIQILPAVYKDDDRSKYMEFTSSYYIQPSMLVTNINDTINTIHDLSNKHIGVIKGFSITSQLKKNYPSINAVEVANVREGLLKVSSRELDGFIESIALSSSRRTT